MASLVLHTYWRSSCSYRVRLALGFKGLAWEPRYVNLLAGEQKGEAYLAMNPSAYVPCLEIDGRAVTESIAILELLEELHPEPALYPKAPFDRARVRAMVETINAGIQPLQNLSVLNRLGEDRGVWAVWAQHWIAKGLAVFESMCATEGPFAFGPAFGAADVLLVPQLYAARRFGVDLAPFPRIARAEKAALALPFVEAARPENQGDAVKAP